jgi:hypothetical protein
MNPVCSGEPVSYLRLERYLQDDLSLAERQRIERHLGECGVCRTCFEQVRGDRVELPALPASASGEPVPLRWWWPALLGGAGAAAAVALVVSGIKAPDGPSLPGARVAVKGGELSIEVVREHAGSIANDPTLFAAGDRFEVRVTCAPGAALNWDLVVFQSDQVFFPLDPAVPLACGNAVTLPGAFQLSGSDPAEVCVEVGADGEPDRERLMRDGRSALAPASGCTTITPAPRSLVGDPE